eukprot:205192_1
MPRPRRTNRKKASGAIEPKKASNATKKKAMEEQKMFDMETTELEDNLERTYSWDDQWETGPLSPFVLKFINGKTETKRIINNLETRFVGELFNSTASWPDTARCPFVGCCSVGDICVARLVLRLNKVDVIDLESSKALKCQELPWSAPSIASVCGNCLNWIVGGGLIGRNRYAYLSDCGVAFCRECIEQIAANQKVLLPPWIIKIELESLLSHNQKCNQFRVDREGDKTADPEGYVPEDEYMQFRRKLVHGARISRETFLRMEQEHDKKKAEETTPPPAVPTAAALFLQSTQLKSPPRKRRKKGPYIPQKVPKIDDSHRRAHDHAKHPIGLDESASLAAMQKQIHRLQQTVVQFQTHQASNTNPSALSAIANGNGNFMENFANCFITARDIRDNSIITSAESRSVVSRITQYEWPRRWDLFLHHTALQHRGLQLILKTEKRSEQLKEFKRNPMCSVMGLQHMLNLYLVAPSSDDKLPAIAEVVAVLDMLTEWIHSRNTTTTCIYRILTYLCTNIASDESAVDILSTEKVRDMRVEHYGTERANWLWTKGLFDGRVRDKAPLKGNRQTRLRDRNRNSNRFIARPAPVESSQDDLPPYLKKFIGKLPMKVLNDGKRKSVCWQWQAHASCSYPSCRYTFCRKCIVCEKPGCHAGAH